MTCVFSIYFVSHRLKFWLKFPTRSIKYSLYNLFQASMQKATTIIGITVGNKRSYSIYYAKIELPIATDTDTDTDTFLSHEWCILDNKACYTVQKHCFRISIQFQIQILQTNLLSDPRNLTNIHRIGQPINRSTLGFEAWQLSSLSKVQSNLPTKLCCCGRESIKNY